MPRLKEEKGGVQKDFQKSKNECVIVGYYLGTVPGVRILIQAKLESRTKVCFLLFHLLRIKPEVLQMSSSFTAGEIDELESYRELAESMQRVSC